MAWFQNIEIANSNPSNYFTNPDRYVLTNYFKIKPELKTHYLQLLNNLPDSVDRTEHSHHPIRQTLRSVEAYLIDRYEKKNTDTWVAQPCLSCYMCATKAQTLAVMKDALTQLETPALKYAETYTYEFFSLLIQLLEAEPSTNDSSIHQIIKAIASYEALAKPYNFNARACRSSKRDSIRISRNRQALEKNIDQIEALPSMNPN